MKPATPARISGSMRANRATRRPAPPARDHPGLALIAALAYLAILPLALIALMAVAATGSAGWVYRLGAAGRESLHTGNAAILLGLLALFGAALASVAVVVQRAEQPVGVR